MKAYVSLIIVVLLVITGCSPYKILTQTRSRVDLTKYNTLYIGWLDLGSDSWATNNYSSEKEWLSMLKSVNESAVPSYFREAFPDKNLIISKSPKDTPPADSLYIKFTNAAFLYYDDVLAVTIHCIDGKSKQELSAVSVRIKADYGIGYAGYSFNARFINTIHLLAQFIKKMI